MKKAVAMILTACMLISLTACGGNAGGSGDPSQAEGTAAAETVSADGATSLKDYPFDASRKSTANTDERYPYVEYAQSMSPTEWQPYNLQDAGKTYAKHMLYEFLFDRVGADEFEPRIGKSWTEEDETTYLVEIYDNVYDSEGNHITASDVVFSYELNANSGYAENFEDFESIEEVDEYSVRIHLKQPFSMLGSFAAIFANVAIVSEDEYDETGFSRSPIGTGPYIMTEFVTDSYCVFEARDDYWQSDDLRAENAKANVQEIRIDFVTDSAMRMIMLENGTSLCNPYLTASDVDSFLPGGQYEGQYNLTTDYNTQSQVILANMNSKSIMSDINMRLAVWYALNTDGMVAGLGENVTGGCKTSVSPAIGDFDESWINPDSYQNVYSLEKSKEYLDKAGYNGETIKIITGTYQAKKDLAQIIAEMLRQAGINTEVTVVEYVVESSTCADASGWDLHVVSGTDMDYCVLALYQVYSKYGTFSNDGVSSSFITDEEFQNKLSECASPEGYSAEATKELMDMIEENAYGYGCTFTKSYFAWNKIVTNPKTPYEHKNIPLWNCCDYYLD